MNIQQPITETFSDAAEFQVMGAQLAVKLASDEFMARRCMAAYCEPYEKPDGAFVNEMYPMARYTWRYLASKVMEKAAPFAWDLEAVREVSALATTLAPDRTLAPAELPSARGWWWLGFRPPSGNRVLCAFAWDSTDEGVVLFPFFNVVAQWQRKTLMPSPIGPLSVGGMPIPYGLPLTGIEAQWPPEAKGRGRDNLNTYARFFLAGCSALQQLQVVVHSAEITPRKRRALQKFYDTRRVAKDVRVVTLPPQAPEDDQ